MGLDAPGHDVAMEDEDDDDENMLSYVEDGDDFAPRSPQRSGVRGATCHGATEL